MDGRKHLALLRRRAFWLGPLLAVVILLPWFIREYLEFGDPLVGVKIASEQLPNYMPGVSMPALVLPGCVARHDVVDPHCAGRMRCRIRDRASPPAGVVLLGRLARPHRLDDPVPVQGDPADRACAAVRRCAGRARSDARADPGARPAPPARAAVRRRRARLLRSCSMSPTSTTTSLGPWCSGFHPSRTR